jgi:hypothetical protein
MVDCDKDTYFIQIKHWERKGGITKKAVTEMKCNIRNI